MKAKTNRNAFIELFRFLAAASIVAYHYEYLYIGKSVFLKHFYIWVEFFFVLSGFFVAANAVKNSEYKSTDYVIKELKKLYPIYFLGFIISFILHHILNSSGVRDIILSLWNSKNEILLLNMFVLSDGNPIMNIGGAPQYIGVLLLSTLVLHFLISKHRGLFTAIIGPLAAIIGYAHILNSYGNLSQWAAFDGWLNIGIIRGFAGMSVGALAYLVLLPNINKMNSLFRKTVFVCLVPSVFCLVLFRKIITEKDLLIYVLIFSILISVIYSIGSDFDSHKSNILQGLSEIVNGFGKISYPMFVLHYPIIRIMAVTTPEKNYWCMLMLCEVFVIAISFLIVWIFQKRSCNDKM